MPHSGQTNVTARTARFRCAWSGMCRTTANRTAHAAEGCALSVQGWPEPSATGRMPATVNLNVDLDIMLAVLAQALTAALRARLPGYAAATPEVIQRRFPKPPARSSPPATPSPSGSNARLRTRPPQGQPARRYPHTLAGQPSHPLRVQLTSRRSGCVEIRANETTSSGQPPLLPGVRDIHQQASRPHGCTERLHHGGSRHQRRGVGPLRR